ncbi:MAG: hypothetical protein ACKPKO_06140, partial [Candidatus Fonsibacter sp.]
APVADQPANKKPRPRFNIGVLQVAQETPQAPAPQPVRRRLRKPIEETPQAHAPQPVRRRLRKPIEETPQSPAPQPVRRRLRKPLEETPFKYLLQSGLESLQNQQSHIYYLHREVHRAAPLV